MFGNKREKIKNFIGRLQDYKVLELKIVVMLKNKDISLEGVITQLGKDFIEISDAATKFVSIPFCNIDGVMAMAKDEWKPKPREEPMKPQPIQKKVQYMKLGEVDY